MPATPRSVVVVGAGLAGARTVTALRENGFEGRITVLGAETLEPYDRPPLSKHLLDRTEPAWLREEVGADLTQADDVRLGTAATGLSVRGEDGVEGPGGVTVTTADGDVHADAAVLATGAAPVRPPGWESALVLHTADDAAALRARLRSGTRLVVVGAGWIGAEVAGVAAAAGVDVTVVEAAATPLAVALGERVGALTAPWYAEAGVRLLTSSPVAAVTADGVTLADGRTLRADLVLAAVGVRPATAWLGDALPRGADGSVDVGPDHLVPGTGGRVAAVGDLARRRSPRHGTVPGGHWDGALRAPAIAVRALLGVPAPASVQGTEDPAPYVFSTQLGRELALYGLPGPDDDVVLRGRPDGPFTALWFNPGSDVLVAALTVDRPRDVAAARRLFAGPSLPRLDRSLAADPDRPLKDAAGAPAR